MRRALLLTSARVAPRPRRFTSAANSIAEKAGEASSTAGEAVKETLTSAKSRLHSVWDMYSTALTDYPIRTNAATSGLLCGGGDTLAQFFEYRLGIMSPEKDRYNWPRTARMALWGTAIGGPVLAVWYRALHTTAEALSVAYAPVVVGRLAWLAERTPALQWLSNLHVEKAVPVASPAKVLFGKVAVDTMLFQAPFLNLYFAVMGALEGLSVSEILEKTRASFHRAWALSFLVWTPVQAINLYFVPVPFQPTVVAAVNVGWKTTLSLLNHYHDYGSPRSPNPALRTGGSEDASGSGSGGSGSGGSGSGGCGGG